MRWILALSLLVATDALALPDFRGVEYVSCYDGDTCKFNIPEVHPLLGEKISVRIRGVDTPEIRGKCSKAKAIIARDFLRKLLASAKTIALRNVGRGKFFRLIADVHADGVDVGGVLLKEGYAVAYDGKSKRRDWC